MGGATFAVANTWLAAAAPEIPPAASTAAPARAFNTRTASGFAPPRKFRVGVLGATGAVGQRFLEHLEGHPWFEVTRVGASDRSVGKRYADAANWMVTPNVPGYVKDMKVVACAPEDFGKDVDLVFSALVRGRPQAEPPPPPLDALPRRPAPRLTPPQPRPFSPPRTPTAGRARGCHRGARLPRRGRARV
jgi:hypothetical protein